MHIVILYATFSAKGRSRKIAAQLEAELKQHAPAKPGAWVHCSVFENTWPETLPAACTYVVVIGGDGTFNYFVNAYPGCTVPVILMAGGTGNDFFWKVHGKKTPAEMQQAVVELATGKRPDTKRLHSDVGQCSTDGAAPRFFLNSVGLGFDGEVLRSMKAIRLLGGHLGYLAIVVKKMFSFREPFYEFRSPEKTYTQSCTLVNIANSSRTGGGFLISPHAEINDGKLNLFHCYIPSLWTRIKVLSQVEKGKHIGNKTVLYEPVTELQITADRKLFSQMDGELIEGTTYSFALAKWKLELVLF